MKKLKFRGEFLLNHILHNYYLSYKDQKVKQETITELESLSELLETQLKLESRRDIFFANI